MFPRHFLPKRAHQEAPKFRLQCLTFPSLLGSFLNFLFLLTVLFCLHVSCFIHWKEAREEERPG